MTINCQKAPLFLQPHLRRWHRLPFTFWLRPRWTHFYLCVYRVFSIGIRFACITPNQVKDLMPSQTEVSLQLHLSKVSHFNDIYKHSSEANQMYACRCHCQNVTAYLCQVGSEVMFSILVLKNKSLFSQFISFFISKHSNTLWEKCCTKKVFEERKEICSKETCESSVCKHTCANRKWQPRRYTALGFPISTDRSCSILTFPKLYCHVKPALREEGQSCSPLLIFSTHSWAVLTDSVWITAFSYWFSRRLALLWEYSYILLDLESK